MIAVTGASGFLGRAVCAALAARGERVLRIGRRDSDVAWPAPGTEFERASLDRLRGVRAVVHLAGESIGRRWTSTRRRAIRDSRVGLTASLARALATLDRPPEVMVSVSAVGYYGSRGDEWLTEASTSGSDFLASVTRDWEAAASPAREAGVRVVHPRLGVVLGAGGGMVAQLRLPFSLALGARLGSGAQWLSWISLDDAVRLLMAAIDDRALSGPVNAASPAPVTNAEFTAAFARALRRPAPFVAPAFALRLLFGEMADGVLLASQRVRPARLLAGGFAFAHPSIDAALDAALVR